MGNFVGPLEAAREEKMPKMKKDEGAEGHQDPLLVMIKMVMTSQMTPQDMMRHSGPYDKNQHIQKLLNQNKYHQDF